MTKSKASSEKPSSESDKDNEVEGRRNQIEALHSDDDGTKPAIILGAGFIVGGIVGAVLVPADPWSGFLLFGFIGLFIGWMYGTESGKEFIENVVENMEQQQQQQSSGSSKPKIVCSSCGWQNPQDNNYCHDCGAELGA